MNTKSILQMATLILKERELENRLKAIRSRREALGRYSYSGMSTSAERDDLTLSISLGEYLTAFADKNPLPKPRSYESEDRKQVGENFQTVGLGMKTYFQYPQQFVGTLPTKPPTHIWADASTDAVWAQGDPKPLVVVETAVAA